MFNELKFDAPTSRKMEEIAKRADEAMNNYDKSNYCTLSSVEHQAILNKKENRAFLNKLIDKKIARFLKEHDNISEQKMKEITDVYDSVSKSIYDAIEKIESTKFKFAYKFTIWLIKKYKPSVDEKVFLFTPVLDQPIETEYDINLFVTRDVYLKEDKLFYASTLFEFDRQISKKYFELAKYYDDNKDIWYYEKLVREKEQINSKRILFTGRYIKILENKKMVIDKDNNYKDYKDEIALHVIETTDTDKFNKIKDKFIKHYFRKTKYNAWYEQLRWIIIETFYDSIPENEKTEDWKRKEKSKRDANKEFLTKKERDIFEWDKSIKYIIWKKEVTVREKYRTDIKIVREMFDKFLTKIGISNISDFAYISDFEYPELEWEKNRCDKIHRYTKIKD